jgi:phosphoribosylglycinamide formyltransferase-1
MVKLAIFASGAGSNAAKIIEHFAGNKAVIINLIVSNKKEAGVLGIAAAAHIDTLLINRNSFYATADCVNELKIRGIDFIVLAGFLWKIPETLIEAYPNRIINIHPALLPNYGGKGMYGNFVHEAVIAAGEKESGITIHYVDAHYDEGDIIFQAKCSIEPTDTPSSLATKIHALEHTHFPVVIENLLKKLA